MRFFKSHKDSLSVREGRREGKGRGKGRGKGGEGEGEGEGEGRGRRGGRGGGREERRKGRGSRLFLTITNNTKFALRTEIFSILGLRL